MEKKAQLKLQIKFFAAKINKKLLKNVFIKIIANFKGRKAKTKQKNEINWLNFKNICTKKAQVMQDMQVEKLQYLLVEVLHMDQKEN